MSVAGRWDPLARDAGNQNIGAWVLDSLHSPCIDRGEPDNAAPYDWESEPAPNAARINMGAYGGTSAASKSNSAPRVISMAPAPSSAAASGVAEIALQFDSLMEPATLWPPSFQLLSSGGDGGFTQGNESVWTIDEVQWDSGTFSAIVVLDTPCQFLPRDTYQVTARDELRSAAGQRLDGEYGGSLPSGDGWEGGDFVAVFAVPNAPPVAFSDHFSLLQDAPATALPPLTGCDADGDGISFKILWSGPVGRTEHGTLTPGADSARWVYQPDLGWSGIDWFHFQAYDGTSYSSLRTFQILVAPQPCDLQPISLGLASPPADLHMGQTIQVVWSGVNNGPGSTAEAPWGDWQDCLYLSADNRLDDADILLGCWTSDASPLVAGGQYAASLDVALPSELEWSGAYYLIVEANANGTQLETNAKNNVLAAAITLQPYVELIRPYCGRYTDNQTPLGFQWRDVDQQYSAAITLYVDNDNDPLNGVGHQELAGGILENPDGAGDEAMVYLPGLTPREAPYYVWAKLTNPSGNYISDPVAIRVFDSAYYSDEAIGDATGGLGYETLGIEAGLLGDAVHYRVLTNFPPVNRGGDVYVNVGGTWQRGDGTVHGIAVNSQTPFRTPVLTPGDLYTYARFRTGVVRHDRPMFIIDWAGQVSGSSSAVVHSPPCLPWGYVIEGHFQLSALPNYDEESIQIAWSMYCGNDITDVVIPGRRTLQILEMDPLPACLCPPTYGSVADVTVRFNKPADPATVNEQNFRVVNVGLDGRYGTADDVAVPAANVSYNDVRWTATFTPASPLQPGHSYAAVVNDQSEEFALDFDGVNDYLATPLNIDQGFLTIGATFEAWVYPTRTSGGRQPVISTDNGGDDWSIVQEGGSWRVLTGEASRDTQLPVDLRTWQHIAAVFTPGVGVTFYKNGQGVFIPFIGHDFVDDLLTIGGNPRFQQYFDGKIAEARVWNGGRSAEQIQAMMYRELTGQEAGLLAYWRSEEGLGQTLYDSGPDRRHGTLGANVDPASDDPTWTSSEAPVGGVTDTAGKPLDGEFFCQFPSGDGVHGGEFAAMFMVGVNYPNVIAMTPSPGQAMAPDTGLAQIHVTFDAPMEPITLYPGHFELLGSGGDGAFGNGNEIPWPVAEVQWDEPSYTATLSFELPCGYLPRDQYRLTVRDDVLTICGLPLDGEFTGAFPSGNGAAGGDFVASFEILNSPPIAHPGQASVVQDLVTALPELTGCDADGDALSFVITRPPRNGTLTAGADSAHWSYQPKPGFLGADDFEFVVFDSFNVGGGIAFSGPALFSITVVEAACDLRPTLLTIDTAGPYGMGAQIALSWTGVNQGPGTAVELAGVDWINRVYLSADQLLGAGDRLLGGWSSEAAPLAASGPYSASLNVVLPHDLDWSGAYYLILQVNSAGHQAELDTANNLLAVPIALNPFVEILKPYDGRFVDNLSPVRIQWRDVDQQFSAMVSWAVDSDNDPANGVGHQWLAVDLPEDPDGASDSMEVMLPGLAPRIEPYYLWARLDNGAGQYYSQPLPIRVFERAFVTEDPLGDTVGGAHFEIHGIEAGILEGLVYFRVHTDYDPQANGGDMYLNAGGTWQSGGGGGSRSRRDIAPVPGR